MVNNSNSARLKRIKRYVRPLLSKIKQLNDAYTTNSKLFDLNVRDIYKKNTYERDSRYGLNNDDDSGDDDDDDYDDYDDHDYSVKPRFRLDSPDLRLEFLSEYISPELYHEYKQFFEIVKSVMETLSTGCSHHNLASRCAVELGKEMALFTRSSYYRLGNVSLFDQDWVDPQISKLSGCMYQDVDEWLCKECDDAAGALVLTHAQYLFGGYVVRLLVIHCNTILYMLIPVIYQWMEQSSNPYLLHLSKTLLDEFWTFNKTTKIDIEHINGVYFANAKVLFWGLDYINYWPMDNKQRICAFIQHYDYKLLEKLARLRRVDEDMDNVFMLEYMRLDVDNPDNSELLVLMLKSLLKKVRTSATQKNRAVHFYHVVLKQAQNLLDAWIAPGKHSLYNARYPHNATAIAGFYTFESTLRKKLKTLARESDHSRDAGFLLLKLGAFKQRLEAHRKYRDERISRGVGRHLKQR
ncbi:uncharacterized protein LODBEIA_P08600 [Lodderomyces beijingensis]|uniref:Uncharacterized protein n=1 Tax=Lodderomyces beijingensis TaxID=1775926 RepID=A0ABP0ZHQ5_9ASCO